MYGHKVFYKRNIVFIYVNIFYILAMLAKIICRITVKWSIPKYIPQVGAKLYHPTYTQCEGGEEEGC